VVWHHIAEDCPDVIRALLALRDPRVRWIKESRYAVLIPN
jgi:hypothetical protein